MSENLLEIEDLTVQYQTREKLITAVSDASFTIQSGDYFGLAGESGSGKSTLAKAIIGGLDDNGQITSGTIRYKGEEIQDFTEDKLNDTIRWKEISWIPQGSMDSLDPLMKISEQAVMIAKEHTDLTREQALDRFREMFDIVGLQESRIHDYPHQFSGGMQQRAVIALALFLDPSLIIADEPTTALDVIMQDQIFKHLDEIKERTDTSLLLITHDISLIFESCDEIAIMHASQIAENGSVEAVYDDTRHPYTLLFKQAFPDVRYPNRDLDVIDGYPPQLFGEVNKCSFVDRCPWAVEECATAAPKQKQVSNSSANHEAACFREDEVYRLYDGSEDLTAQGGAEQQ